VPNEIEAAVDELVTRLQTDYTGTLTVRKDPAQPGDSARAWSIQPVRDSASPLWIVGVGWNDVTVGFGRSSSRIELWQMGKVIPSVALANLERVCRSVIEGRLTEWRQDRRACRYDLVLPDGTHYVGRANSLLRRRWRTVETFSSYADIRTE
jgi:hypothetical protein